MRIFAIVLTLLVAVAIALALLGERLIARDELREEVIERVEAGIGGQLAIDGPIEVALFPLPQIRLAGVQYVAHDGDHGPFGVRAERIDAVVRPLDLLRGRIRVERLTLVRPTVTLDLDEPAGLALLLQPGQPLPRPALREGLGNLNTLRIVDGTLVLDAPNGTARSVTLAEIDLAVEVTAPRGPVALEGAFTLASQRLRLESRIGQLWGAPSTTLQLRLSSTAAADSPFDLAFSGLATTAGAPVWQGRLEASLANAAAALSAVAGVGADPRSLPDWLHQGLTLDATFEATPRLLTFENLGLVLAGSEGGGRIDLVLGERPTIDAVLAFREPDLGKQSFDVLAPAALLGWLPERLTGTIDLTLDALRLRGQLLRRARVTAALQEGGAFAIEQGRVTLPGGADLRFRGRGRRGQAHFAGEIALVSERLRDLLAWLELEPEGLSDESLRRLGLTASVELTPGGLGLDRIESRLDASRITGSAEVGLRAPASTRLALEVDRLDLDTYLPTRDAAAMGRILARIAAIDLEVAARFGTLTLGGLRWTAVDLAAAAGAGRVAVDRLAGSGVGETDLRLSGRIDFQAQEGSGEVAIGASRPTLLLRRLGIDPFLGLTRLAPFRLDARLTWRDPEVGIDLEGRLQEIGFSAGGAADTGEGTRYALDVQATHPDYPALLQDLALALEDPAAGGAARPLELTGRLSGVLGDQIALAGSLALGATRATGEVVYQSMTPRPRVRLNLSLANPRVATLLPLLGLSGVALDPAVLSGPIAGNWPRQPLNPRLAEAFDLALTLNAKGGLAGQGLELSAELSDGRLLVPRIAARPFGGEVSGEATFDLARAPPFGAIALTLDDLEVIPLSRWLGVPEVIEGRLNGQLEASSLGASPYEIARNLAAEATLSVQNGRLLTGLRTPGDPADRSGRPLPHFEVRFDVARGIATIASTRSNATPPPLELEGAIDLLLWVTDLTATLPALRDPAAPATTLRIVGPIDRPQVVISAAAPPARVPAPVD